MVFCVFSEFSTWFANLLYFFYWINKYYVQWWVASVFIFVEIFQIVYLAIYYFLLIVDFIVQSIFLEIRGVKWYIKFLIALMMLKNEKLCMEKYEVFKKKFSENPHLVIVLNIHKKRRFTNKSLTELQSSTQ